jgi:hypothetical protein
VVDWGMDTCSLVDGKFLCCPVKGRGQSRDRRYVNHGEQGAPTIVELRQDVTHEEHAGFGRERTLLKGLNRLYASIINMGRRFETR